MHRGFRLVALLVTLALSGPAGWADEDAKLTAGDAAAEDRFGTAVSMSTDTVVVGSYQDGDAGPFSGSAYVYVRSGTDWVEQQKLVASDGAAQDLFGLAVAVSGDTAVMGAVGDDDGGSGSGSAYVFVRVGTTWSQQQKLTARDAAPGDSFGGAVAISGDTIAVGSRYDSDLGFGSGAVYVFVRSGTTWSQEQKLTASDGAEKDLFSGSVSISADTLLVGASGHGHAGSNAGAAYVFVRSGTTWTQQQELISSNAAAGDRFGTSVSISGDSALIGSPFSDGAGDYSGAAYVFVRSGTTWSEQQILTLNDQGPDDQFGAAVSIAGDLAVIGDNRDSGNSVAAHSFLRSGMCWSQQPGPVPSDVARGDNFGFSVSLSGQSAVIGSPGDGDAGFESGSAYIFTLSTTPDADPGVASCFGVGCPCGNDDPVAGCANSTGVGGLLSGSGSSSAGADDLVLTATQLPPFNTGLVYMGDTEVLNPFFDGLQCALGNTWRFLCCSQNSGASGTMTLGPGVIANAGGLIDCGETWHFQTWHRDFPGSPCGTSATVTNMFSTTFTP